MPELIGNLRTPEEEKAFQERVRLTPEEVSAIKTTFQEVAAEEMSLIGVPPAVAAPVALGIIGKHSSKLLNKIRSLRDDRKIAHALNDAGFDPSDPQFAAIMGSIKHDLALERRVKSGETVMPTPSMTAPAPTKNWFSNPKMVNFAADLLRVTGTRLGPKNPSEQITELLMGGRVGNMDLRVLLKKHGISPREASQIIQQKPSLGANLLGDGNKFRAQAVKAGFRVKQLAGDPRAVKYLQKASQRLQKGGAIGTFWNRWDNRRRGLMVSQLGTAVRNFVSSGARLPLNMFVDGIDASINLAMNAATGGKFGNMGTPISAVPNILKYTMRGVVGKNKKLADEILSAFPAEMDRAYLRVASDFDQGEGFIDQAIMAMNIFNRVQDYAIRRVSFLSELDKTMRKKGVLQGPGDNLQKLINRGEIDKIDEKSVVNAVQESLDVTFAKEPTMAAAKEFVSIVHRFPLGTLAIPFPRFLTNSARFLYEGSGMKFVSQLLRGNAWEKLKQGDNTLAKGIGGLTMFWAGKELFDAHGFMGYTRGENWHTLRNESTGDSVDIRGYGPLAMGFLISDVVDRMQEGRLTRDWVKTNLSDIVGMQARGVSTALDSLDSSARMLGEGLVQLVSLGELAENNTSPIDQRKMQSLVADWANTYLTPIQMFTDAYSAFEDEPNRIRFPNQKPFPDKFGARLPDSLMDKLGLEKAPIRRDPLVEGSKDREGPFGWNPVFRQILGITPGQKSSLIKREVDYLGLDISEYFSFSGIPIWDNEVAGVMSQMVNSKGVPFDPNKKEEAEFLANRGWSEKELQSMSKGEFVLVRSEDIINSPQYKNPKTFFGEELGGRDSFAVRAEALDRYLSFAQKKASTISEINNPELWAAKTLLRSPKLRTKNLIEGLAKIAPSESPMGKILMGAISAQEDFSANVQDQSFIKSLSIAQQAGVKIEEAEIEAVIEGLVDKGLKKVVR